MEIVLALSVMTLMVAATALWLHPNHKDGQWHDWRGKKRRYMNGAWQYRELTDAERNEDWANQQW